MEKKHGITSKLELTKTYRKIENQQQSEMACAAFKMPLQLSLSTCVCMCAQEFLQYSNSQLIIVIECILFAIERMVLKHKIACKHIGLKVEQESIYTNTFDHWPNFCKRQK